MRRRNLIATAALLSMALSAPLVMAQGNEPFKVGLILPMTGQQASTGRQVLAGVRQYMAEHGDTVAGRKIEIIVKDDVAVADSTKRIAQELIVNEKVGVIAGFGITPCALAAAPLATQSKTPEIVMAAATSSITDASPFVVRSSFTLPQVSGPLADWATKNGIKSVVTLVSDYGPGHDAEKFFSQRFEQDSGKVMEMLHVPLMSPDFGPFLQKVRDSKPDALFVFVPSGLGAEVMKQFVERGMNKTGLKLIGPGDLTDDDLLNGMGDAALGVVTSHHYSAAHPSETNQKYVAAFEKNNSGMRPNFMSVGGYDGMHLVYAALEKTHGGEGGGAALLEAMKGLAFESPRGPITIDPQTREVIQNVYLRKVEKKSGALYNVEFDVIKQVKDPAKIK